MKRLLIVVVLIVVGIAILGWSRGWFQVGTDNTDGKSNVTISVDKDKFEEDKKAAVANVQDAGRQAKDKVAGSSARTMEGTLVSVSADKLTMTDKDGKEHSHALAADVKVTCDGQTCTAADLKAGMRIRVTERSDATHAVTRIEALDKKTAFEKAG